MQIWSVITLEKVSGTKVIEGEKRDGEESDLIGRR